MSDTLKWISEQISEQKAALSAASKLPSIPAGEIASEDEYDTPERIAALVQQAEKECTGKPDDWRDFIAELAQPSPEAAAALCEDEGCPHYGTAHICVSKTKLDELRRIIREQEDFINAQEEELNERPAPIAPAAQDLIAELEKALKGVLESWGLGVIVAGKTFVAERLATLTMSEVRAALARAESYRKESEAKNAR